MCIDLIQRRESIKEVDTARYISSVIGETLNKKTNVQHLNLSIRDI